MRRGRKPKPNVLKILDGSRVPLSAGEPNPAPGAPQMPTQLTAEAKKEWRRVVPELAAVGLLSKIDRGSLSLLCEAWAEYRSAQERLDEEGTVLTNTAGNEVLNPWWRVRNEAIARYRVLTAEFGLSPSARQSLKVTAQKTPQKTRLQELLG